MSQLAAPAAAAAGGGGNKVQRRETRCEGEKKLTSETLISTSNRWRTKATRATGDEVPWPKYNSVSPDKASWEPGVEAIFESVRTQIRGTFPRTEITLEEIRAGLNQVIKGSYKP